MRHEAACTSPSAMQQTSSAASIFKELQGTTAAESGTQPQAAVRRSPKPMLLRDQHMPGELLHQKTAFPSDVFMRHEAATQQLPSADESVKASQQQQQAALPLPQQTATAGRSLSNWASSRPTSPTAASDATSSVPASVTMLPAAVSVVLPPPRSDSTASEMALGSSVQGSVQSLRRGSSRLKQSSKRSPRTPRPAAEPWFETTSHDLARNNRMVGNGRSRRAGCCQPSVCPAVAAVQRAASVFAPAACAPGYTAPDNSAVTAAVWACVITCS